MASANSATVTASTRPRKQPPLDDVTRSRRVTEIALILEFAACFHLVVSSNLVPAFNSGYDTDLGFDLSHDLECNPDPTLGFDSGPVLNFNPSPDSPFCFLTRFRFRYRSRFQVSLHAKPYTHLVGPYIAHGPYTLNPTRTWSDPTLHRARSGPWPVFFLYTHDTYDLQVAITKFLRSISKGVTRCCTYIGYNRTSQKPKRYVPKSSHDPPSDNLDDIPPSGGDSQSSREIET
ncbi:hypothetical protein EVAR_11537_1 [Eumeta japonica]|uniref:Uncharacterized protein n=1 Tax=Eumeta variegata TaxID=151549 RepID=A0A4C1TZH5_EUMVA|nr:hypothetical protein EVAR_11537_1 [Eumeta japonica]